MTATAKRTRTMPALTEREWQSRVIDYSRLRSWRCYHAHDSRRSEPGLPDLLLARPGRLVVAELKSERGRLTREQAQWLDLLGTVAGVEVYTWRPSSWSQVLEVLR